MSGLQLKSPRKLSQKTSIPPSKSYKSYRKTGIIPKTTLHRWQKKYGDKIPEYLFNQQCHSNKNKDKVSRGSDTPDKCGQVCPAHSSASSFNTQRVFEGFESFVIPECAGEDVNLASEQADANQGEEEQEEEVSRESNFPDRTYPTSTGFLQEPDKEVEESSNEEVITEAMREESDSSDDEDPDSDCDDVCTTLLVRW